MFHVSYFNSSLPLINESITFYSTSCTYLLIEVFTRLLLLLTLIVSTTSPQQIVSNVSNNSCHSSIHPEKPRNLQQSERTPNTAKRCFSNRKCWKEVIQLEQISRGLFWVTCGFQVLEIDNTGSGQWQWRPPAPPPALARLEHLTTFYNMLRLSRRVLQFCPPPYI